MWARSGRGEGEGMEAGREWRSNKVTTQTEQPGLRAHTGTEREELRPVSCVYGFYGK